MVTVEVAGVGNFWVGAEVGLVGGPSYPPPFPLGGVGGAVGTVGIGPATVNVLINMHITQKLRTKYETKKKKIIFN